MEQFSIKIPTEIIFGEDSLLWVGERLGSLNINKVIIITEQLHYESGLIGKVENILKNYNIDYIIYDEINPVSGSEDILNISILTRTSRAEVVIGLGGQKCLNIAKGVSLFSYNEKSIYFYLKNPDLLNLKIPNILILTSPRDYFALTDSIYFRDNETGLIQIFKHKNLITDYLIVDPFLFEGLPEKTLLSILVEMIGYSFDSMVSKKSTIFTETLLYKGLDVINNNWQKIKDVGNDVDILKEIGIASLFLMIAGKISGFLVVEALSLALNSIAKIPKSIASTIIIPHVLEYYIPIIPDRFLEAVKITGIKIGEETKNDLAMKFVEKIQNIISENNLPERLSHYGLNKEQLWKVVNHSFEYGFFKNSPVPISKEDIFNILYSSI